MSQTSPLPQPAAATEGSSLRQASVQAALLQAISDASADAIYAKDRGGRLLYANPATLDLIGLPASEVLGRTDLEFLADTEVALAVMANDRRIMDTGQPQELEERVPMRDGTERVWLSLKTPWRDAAGQVVGLLGISRDVTERLRLERELLASRQALDRVLDSITDGFAVLDREWTYTYFNEQGARMLGLDRTQIVGSNFWQLFPHARTTRFGAEYERCMATGETAHFEDYYPEPLNRWVACDCYPSAEGLAVFFRDVTERHRDQEALRSSAQQLQRVFDASPIGMATGNLQGRVLQANAAFLSLLGVSADDLHSRRIDWRQLTPAEHLVADEAAIAQLADGAVSRIYEKEYLHSDGHRVPVMVALARYDEAGNELLAFVMDMRAHKHVEEALQLADRRKDEFLAMLAHELRNPMAPLRTGLQVLEREPASPRAAAMLAVMDRQMRHLVRLVDDLLDIARISSGKIRVSLQRIDLRDCVQAAVEACRPGIEEARHTLGVELPPQAVWVQADAVRLTQVLCNLLHNACKYTPAGGRIGIALHGGTGDQVQVVVQDNGSGIRPQLLAEVFDLFVQDREYLPQAQGGLGVGLALVRELVRQHGGSVQAHSAGPGQGSRFTVVLPAAAGG